MTYYYLALCSAVWKREANATLSWSTGAWPARNRSPSPFGPAWHCWGLHWSPGHTMWSFSQSSWLLRKASMIWLVRGHVQMGTLMGAASSPMDMSSLSMASTGSSVCKSQKFRLGVEAVFFSGKSRLPMEAVVWHQRSSEPGWAKVSLDCYRCNWFSRGGESRWPLEVPPHLF